MFLLSNICRDFVENLCHGVGYLGSLAYTLIETAGRFADGAETRFYIGIICRVDNKKGDVILLEIGFNVGRCIACCVFGILSGSVSDDYCNTNSVFAPGCA